MRRQHYILCALLIAIVAACGAHALTPDRSRGSGAAESAQDRFLRFEDAPSATVPEPATLGMIALGGSAMFYPRRRARLYR